MYRASFDFTYTLPLGGPAIGIARALMKAFEERTRARMSGWTPRQLGAQAATLTRMARAGADIDARDGAAAGDGARSSASSRRLRRRCCDGARCAAATSPTPRSSVAPASNSLFEASGGSAIYEDRDLQRLWRDSNVAGAHMGLNWDGASQSYGRALIGLPPFEMPAPKAN